MASVEIAPVEDGHAADEEFYASFEHRRMAGFRIYPGV